MPLVTWILSDLNPGEELRTTKAGLILVGLTRGWKSKLFKDAINPPPLGIQSKQLR